MSRRAIVLVAVATVVLVAVVGYRIWRASEPAASGAPATQSDQPMVTADGDEVRLRLYFPGAGGWLVAEERVLEVEGAGVDLATITAELLAGPAGSGLSAPFPSGTEVGNVFISDAGVAYIDLVSTRPNPPSSGSRQEMLSVYSLVNSAYANLPDLTGVALLWNGQQRNTFAGHLDTGRPLAEDLSIVANGSRPG